MIDPVQPVPKTNGIVRGLLRMLSFVSSGHFDTMFPPVILHRKFSLEVAHHAFLSYDMACPSQLYYLGLCTLCTMPSSERVFGILLAI